MENNSPGNDVQQQPSEQSSAIPLRENPPVGMNYDQEGDRQRGNGISRLEKRVERTSRLMEYLTGLMLIVTFGGVAVAYTQLDTAKVQFSQDQRPYVISVAAPRLLAPDQLIMVDFRNGNYGKSPAIKVGGGGKVFFGDDALAQADRWFREDAPRLFARRNETVLPPNTPASHNEARRTTVTSDRPVGAEELGSLMRKPFSIVAVMRQVYLDSAGNQYWTDSCVSNLAGSDEMAIVECNAHNDIR